MFLLLCVNDRETEILSPFHFYSSRKLTQGEMIPSSRPVSEMASAEVKADE